MKQVDLHTHTIASDGTYTPSENIRRAVEKGMGAIAITDHDTVDGIEEALLEAERHSDFFCVPGIEISTLYEGQDIHVLGYFIDYKDEAFLETLKDLRSVRDKRNSLILQNLKSLGIPVSEEELEFKRHGEGNVGRGHIAEILMEKGFVTSLPEAFDKYLGKGKPGYAVADRISPKEAIHIIKKAKGVPVLAHPGLYDADELIPLLCEEGLVGLEYFHPDHTEEQVTHYKKLAERHSLILTAGSDFHGFRNGEVFHGDIGCCSVERSTIDHLREKV